MRYHLFQPTSSGLCLHPVRPPAQAVASQFFTEQGFGDRWIFWDAQRDRYVRTGNGIILVATGRARELKVGDIVRRDLAIEIADGDNLNVLGMNYLSTLTRWGVEGRWLILEP